MLLKKKKGNQTTDTYFVLCSLISRSKLADTKHCNCGSEKVFTKQWTLTPSPRTQSASRRPDCPQKQPAPAPATLSASFLVTKLLLQRHPGLRPGLTCSLFRFCAQIPAEPIYMAQCPPTDSCIQLQKPRLVELVFWLLFKAIVPVKPQGPSGMRSFGVDE